ncbi:hypothetical protein [Chloroflexus sp.]|uniref:hypothetical protein n=1 Tax=Chloroflexus sp. TaxID=1904827 RepID=UPI002ACD67F0|nr:hypothetical protein [Chloroflexus sp.]
MVEKSTVTSGVFNRRTFSIGLTGSTTRTLRWREDGNLNTVLATTTTLTPVLGFFSYGPVPSPALTCASTTCASGLRLP